MNGFLPHHTALQRYRVIYRSFVADAALPLRMVCAARATTKRIPPMQPVTWWRSALSALLCLSITAAAFAQSDDFDRIGTRRTATAANWGGRAWTATELRSFQVKPETATTNTATNYVLVAYDRFVSFYDVANFAPVWVAYVATRESARVAESGSGRAPSSPVRRRSLQTG